MSKPVDELDVLAIFVDEMEAHGHSHKLVRISIDQEFQSLLNAKLRNAASLEHIQKLADRCLANEWLIHTEMGTKYNSLAITATGVGVVRSKQKSEEARRSRPFLKKVSDVIEDHKGLFIALGALLAIATIALKLDGR